jgi:hypothetical protein
VSRTLFLLLLLAACPKKDAAAPLAEAAEPGVAAETEPEPTPAEPASEEPAVDLTLGIGTRTEVDGNDVIVFPMTFTAPPDQAVLLQEVTLDGVDGPSRESRCTHTVAYGQEAAAASFTTVGVPVTCLDVLDQNGMMMLRGHAKYTLGDTPHTRNVFGYMSVD